MSTEPLAVTSSVMANHGGGNPLPYVVTAIGDVAVTSYQFEGRVVVDVDAPAGVELVVTLNDGDLFRGEVPA